MQGRGSLQRQTPYTLSILLPSPRQVVLKSGADSVHSGVSLSLSLYTSVGGCSLSPSPTCPMSKSRSFGSSGSIESLRGPSFAATLTLSDACSPQPPHSFRELVQLAVPATAALESNSIPLPIPLPLPSLAPSLCFLLPVESAQLKPRST